MVLTGPDAGSFALRPPELASSEGKILRANGYLVPSAAIILKWGPMDIEVIAGKPAAFSAEEKRLFCKLVEAGGEVDTAVLQQNVMDAKALTFARSSEKLLGVAALKVPKRSYRKKVSQSSGFNLCSDRYPFELGYVFVQQAVRGTGLSHRLVDTTLNAADGNFVFATVRTDNPGMLRTLERANFFQVGNEYSGRLANTSIRLLVCNN